MRLTTKAEAEAAWRDVAAAVEASLDARLRRGIAAPIVVAFSGGGDSLALLLAASHWTRAAGRSLIAMTVDHGLSPSSTAWSQWCGDRAARLGVGHRALKWEGPRPSAGLSAAARAARHGLLADAAREAGASVILTGHTADDRLEARAMRADGGSVTEPRPWTPSPVWPAGRGVFILRPLLTLRRTAIRQGLAALGETWIDDPANLDPASPRARARVRIAWSEVPTPAATAPTPELRRLFAASVFGWGGDIAIPVFAVRAASESQRGAYFGAALLSVAGATTPPRGDQLRHLIARVVSGEAMIATLAGARVESDGETARFMRDDGALSSSDRRVGDPVFDGRFEIETASGMAVVALKGRMARLPPSQRETIRTLPPAARRALPATIGKDGEVSCPLLSADPQILARSLVADRLAGAIGLVNDEATILCVGETDQRVLNKAETVERPVHEHA